MTIHQEDKVVTPYVGMALKQDDGSNECISNHEKAFCFRVEVDCMATDVHLRLYTLKSSKDRSGLHIQTRIKYHF